jgi:hypothetical protein
VLQNHRQKEVLAALLQPYTNHRFEDVQVAHYQTFQWIFSDAQGVGEGERDNPNWDSLVNWLSTGTGIFLVSGKPGSGKSTFMKFLYEDSRTHIELAKWAGMSPSQAPSSVQKLTQPQQGDRTLVVAKFFFWRPGTEL